MDVISPKSHIWSKVEKDTLLNTLFIQGKATSGTLPNNSGKSIIDQMASLLCGDMDREACLRWWWRDRPVSYGCVKPCGAHWNNSITAPGRFRN